MLLQPIQLIATHVYQHIPLQTFLTQPPVTGHVMDRIEWTFLLVLLIDRL